MTAVDRDKAGSPAVVEPDDGGPRQGQVVAVAASPAALRRAIRPAGYRATSTGRVMSLLGLVLVGFLVFQVTGSSVTYERSQRLLLERFREIAPLQATPPGCSNSAVAVGQEDGLFTEAEKTGEVDPDEAVEPEIIAAPEPPARGEPIAVLQIPSIGIEEVVVQGTRPADLRSGPGHLRGTAMPGEPGNAAIAGSRLANGAPFRRINELEKGQKIEVTTAKGRFRYEVLSTERVATGDPDPVRAKTGANTLTLVTSAPAFLANERVAVVALLKTKPVKPCFAPVTPDSSETGFDTAPGGLAPVFGWGALLGLAVVAARHLYRRWHRSVAYLLTTPVIVALVVLVFESLGGLLPSTF